MKQKAHLCLRLIIVIFILIRITSYFNSAIESSARAAAQVPYWAAGIENKPKLKNRVRFPFSFLWGSFENLDSDQTQFLDQSVYSESKSYADLDFSSIPDVQDLSKVNEMFVRVRDLRDWSWNIQPELMRRLNWIFPSQWCAMRDHYMTQKLQALGYPVPQQMFIFSREKTLVHTGDYGSPDFWWYHVAPTVRVQDVVYVIDPAMDHKSPVVLSDWIAALGVTPEESDFNLCGPLATRPDLECNQTSTEWSADENEIAEGTLQTALGEEWEAVSAEVGENEAQKILGDSPPW